MSVLSLDVVMSVLHVLLLYLTQKVLVLQLDARKAMKTPVRLACDVKLFG